MFLTEVFICFVDVYSYGTAATLLVWLIATTSWLLIFLRSSISCLILSLSERSSFSCRSRRLIIVTAVCDETFLENYEETTLLASLYSSLWYCCAYRLQSLGNTLIKLLRSNIELLRSFIPCLISALILPIEFLFFAIFFLLFFLKYSIKFL